MRIVIFTQYFPPEVGATQTRLAVFAETLAASGHDVSVVTELPNHPRGVIPPEWRGRLVRKADEGGYTVLRVWVSASPKKSFWRRIAFYATYAINAMVVALTMIRRRPEVVLASSPPLPVLASALATATVWRRPLVIDIRDPWPAVAVGLGELRGRRAVAAAEAVERLLYRKAAAVVCVTPGFTRHVIAHGAAAEKVHLVPNGTLPELFRPEPADPALRKRLGLDDNFVAGYLGLHGIAQDLASVLDAAEHLRSEEGIRFLLVGDGPLKAELVAAARARRLDNVTFADEVPLAEAAQYVNACDVMVVPYRRADVLRSTIQSKTYDYLACGRPVIVMGDGAAKAMIEGSGAGIVIEPEDPAALAATLLELSRDREAVGAMAAQARPLVLRSYDRRKLARGLERILGDAVASEQR